jgi:hypothetical protein
MGWVTSRPLLLLMEVAWRWVFGIPFLAVCWMEFQKILIAVPPQSAGLDALDPQNPWVAAAQLMRAWFLYRSHVVATLLWLAPVAGIAWAVISSVGRSLVLHRLNSYAATSSRFRPLSMMPLQAAWAILLAATWLCWFRTMEWAAATHIIPGEEPDLIGFSAWAIFLSLGFFTLWALVNWVLSVAPLIMLLEDRSPFSALGKSLRLGKDFTSKLIEINLVMGIVNLALIVVAMVLSAAPLPFGDELGPNALHVIDALAILFYLVASDYFQLVRLKGFEEFWKMFRG